MRNWLIGSVAAAALLAGCGGGEKTQATGHLGEQIQVGDVKIAGLQLRAGDAAEAGDVLAALSLSESGKGRVSFAERSTNGADATFENVTISIEDGESPIKAGSLVFKGLDMIDSGASFSQMTLNDIAITPDEGDDGEVKISSIQLTNPSPELSAWVASLMGQGEPAAFPAFEKISFDGLSLGSLRVDGVDNEEFKAFSIGKVDVRQLSADGIGSMVIEGINLDVEDDGNVVKVSLGSMGMAGVNKTVMKALSSGFASGAGNGDPEALAGEVMSLLSANPGDPGYDSFNIDALSADIAGVAVNLPKLDAAVTRDNKGRAIRSVTAPFTMSVKADPEGEFGSQLAGPLGLMGYEVLNFSGQSDVGMDPDKDTFTAVSKDNYLALEDGFKLSYGGAYSGISDFYKAMAKNTQNGDDDGQAMLGALSSVKVSGFDMTFEDNSIVDKAFTLAAAMSGQDAEGLRSQATASVAFLPLMAGQAGVDPAMAAELGTALSKFLDGSGTLSLKLAPDTPLTVADFEDPTTLTKARLGFTATAK